MKNDYSRFNMRLNSDIEVLTNLSVRFDASYSDVDRGLRDDGAPIDPLSGVITSPAFLALAKAPFLSPYAYDKHGHLSHYLAEADDYLEGKFQGRGRLANPVSILEYGEGKNRNSFGNRLVTFAITPKYQFNRHLSLSEHFVLGLVNTNENYYLPIQGVPTFVVDGLNEDTQLNNIAKSQTARETTIQSDTRVTWETSFKASNLKVMGGVRYLSTDYTQTAQSGYNSPNDKKPNMTSSLVFKTTGGADDQTREITWYALADYNLAERYYLNAGVSAQASSRFGSDAGGLDLFNTVWGFFPSVEAAWVLTNESWLSGVKGLDYLRLNAGFDITGNDDINYIASRSYFVSKRMLGEKATGLLIGNIGNTDLQCETTRRLTAGLNGNLFNNRLNIQFNFYKSWTSNLLSLQQLAWTSGLQENWSNDGKLENIGYDVSLGWKVMALKDFTWELGASVGHYINKVTALPDNKSVKTDLYGATILTQVGQPVGVFYGYKTNGVYATSGDAQTDGLYVLKQNGDKAYFEAGDMRFADLYDDPANPGLIDENDMTIIGDPNPKFTFGFNTAFTYRGFTLSANFVGSYGNDIYNVNEVLNTDIVNLGVNITKDAYHKAWTAENMSQRYPALGKMEGFDLKVMSDRFVEDGSYLRLSNVTLSYDFAFKKNNVIKGLNLGVTGSNLFIWTKYSGFDPDVNSYGSAWRKGADMGSYPGARSVTFNARLTF
jgi:TonB-linked SusC/RagA family outer membrane protein